MKIIAIFCAFLVSSVLAFSDEIAFKPVFFVGKVNDTRVTLMIRNDESLQALRKFKGTTLINLEPECILVEVFCEYIDGGQMKIRLPHDDHFTRRTKKLLGLKVNSFIVDYELVHTPNRASKILRVTPIDPKKAN